MNSPADPIPLLDEEARVQFAERLDENFCVSAGAGAGKTTAIVRRIANLALRRHREPKVLSRLVVVTYGKLAAEELRVRTRDLILQQLEPSAAGRQTLLSELRGAFFGTIHSFCLKLIRGHSRFLGLPEHLDLLEDNQVPALWEKFCESDALLSLDLSPTLLARVGRHLTFDQLLELAREYGPEDTAAPEPPEIEVEPPHLDFSAALADGGGRSVEKTREHQVHLRRWIEEFESGAAFLQLPQYEKGSGTFLRAVEAALAPYAHWLNRAAGRLAVQIARAFRDYRLDKGLMSYRDQVFWCRRLLAEPEILATLRQREYIVILDEAQDTDADMFSILTEITRPVDAPLRTWPAAEAGGAGPLPGRFSFVGDDQQAIYSERADLRVYRRYIDAYRVGDGGRYLELSVTMRCPRHVIRVVNGIFGGGRIAQESVEFRELQPRPDCPAGHAWRLALDPLDAAADGRPARSETRFVHECEQLARLLRDRGLERLRVGAWSDVAVLAPRVAWLETAAQIFANHGLPVALLSQKRPARESPRHSWPAALLHVLLHPWDRFELIGVLREIFAVSDVDMARLHRLAGINRCPGLVFWPQVPETLAKGKVPAERLRRALEVLHELRLALPPENPAPGWQPRATQSAEDCGSLSRYVDFVLRKTALLARLEVLGEPAACLDLFRARAWRAECAGVTLRDWVRTLVTTLHDPPPGQVDSPDAIQFVTCQKAKGLEWPAVIPVGMRREILSHREQFPRVEHHDGLTVIHFSSVTVDRERKAAARAREAEEYQRMLYVTLTRARQSLLVPDGNALYAARQPNYQDLVRWSELAPNALFERPPGIEAPVEGTVPPNAEMRSNGVDWFVDDPKLLGEAAEISRRLPRRILPSALVHGAATEIGHSPAGATSALTEEGGRGTNERLFADEEDEAPLASTGGIDYGNWWHEVLERYPWGVQDPVVRREFVSRELDRIDQDVRWLERARAELIRLVESAAHADLVEYGGSFLPEMPFSSARASGEWVEGIMDLVVIARTTEAVWIVDWKTDRRRPSDATEAAFLARLAEKYGPQLRAYAAVFAEGFQRPVARLSLYSTEAGRFAEVPCDEAVQLSGFRQRAANSSLPPTEAPLLPGWT